MPHCSVFSRRHSECSAADHEESIESTMTNFESSLDRSTAESLSRRLKATKKSGMPSSPPANAATTPPASTPSSRKSVTPSTECTTPDSIAVVYRQSRISVGDDGAEVFLCDSEPALAMITPSKLNLLDAELTPSPVKSMRSLDDFCDDNNTTPEKVDFCGLGDCRRSYSPMALCARDMTTACSEDTEYMLARISVMLSVPNCEDAWLGDYWQALGINCDNYGSTGSDSLNDQEAKRNIQRVLRNRAFDVNLNAKHRRLASLRRDLSPFSSNTSSRSTHICDSVRITKSRSFSSGQDQMRPSNSSTRSVTPEKQIPFLQRVLQCGLPVVHESPAFVRSDNEEMFYDSDPEDFLRRHRSSRAQRSGDGKENALPSSTRRRTTPICLRHDHQVAALVQETMNDQLTLILHHNTAASKHVRSHGVCCWIERGQQLRSSIIAPKLYWKAFPTPALVQLRVKDMNHSVNFINLMDISRILSVTTDMINRKDFPFCKPKHSFFVKTLDQTLLFEAISSTERDRIVKALRLVVARLGSLLLTNNEQLADEYFAFVDQGQGGSSQDQYWMNNNN